MHVAIAVAPIVVKYVPALQSVHVAEPGTVLYFPAAHAVHVLDVDPMLQEATKPEENKEASDVNTTCMYPVLDV